MTRFKIDWDDNPSVENMQAATASTSDNHRENAEDSNGPLKQIFQESNHSMEMEVM